MRQLESSFSPSVVQKETGFTFQASNNLMDWIEQFETVAGIYKDKAKLSVSDEDKNKMEEKYSKFSLFLGCLISLISSPL